MVESPGSLPAVRNRVARPHQLLTGADEFPEVRQTVFGLNKRINFIYDVLAGMGRPVRVLDVGCGTGAFVAIPLAEKGFEVEGIDTDESSLAHGRELVDKQGLDVTFRCAKAAEVSGTYDVVILSEVLEHVKPPGPLLATLRGLLSPDGLLIVTVPNGFGPFEIDQFLWKRNFLFLTSLYNSLSRRLVYTAAGDGYHSPATCNEDNPHVNFFSWRAIHRVLAEAGLEVTLYGARTFIAGSYSSILSGVMARVGLRCRSLLNLNARVADSMPPQMVAGWMFVCQQKHHHVTTT